MSANAREEISRMERQAFTRARRLFNRAYAFYKAHPGPETEQQLEWARKYLESFTRPKEGSE
jgi:hypothetical protein